jgi:tetratricopeptide (TPR) repeat protein
MTLRNLIFVLVAVAAPAVCETPAEVSIRKAQEEVAKKPGHAPYYNALAMAYARRARETSDVAYYAKAQETVKKSLQIAPDNFEARKVEAWLLLGNHEFANALEAATKLNQRAADDVTVYGYLVDANAELGNYQAAVDAAQWMLNLRPGNVAGLTRAGYLRELHGDFEGAIELMQMAYDSTPYQEVEDRAWLLTQIAHLHLAAGDLAQAEKYASGALEVFPDYHYGLGTLGQVRMRQKRYADAATLFRKRYAAAPHAENLFALAEALQVAGARPEAAQAFAEFERKALAESRLADNANHELAAYYTDYAARPDEALRITEQELKRRHDAYTLDAHAWALAGTGDYARAQVEMAQALAWGLKDAKVLEHAQAIAQHAAGVARAGN